jgi:hypothetical protein
VTKPCVKDLCACVTRVACDKVVCDKAVRVREKVVCVCDNVLCVTKTRGREKLHVREMRAKDCERQS